MTPDSLDFILRGTDDEQAEYAAAHKPSVTPAPSPRSGVADTDSSDADAVGALASEDQTPAGAFEPDRQPRTPRPQVSPRWSAVDDETADLLSLVASEHPATPEEEREWKFFVTQLREVALIDGLIDQNFVRPRLRGEIKPQRIGAFYHRATKSGLIRAEGWNTSNDLEGKNGGKPTRVYRWLGT